MAFREDGTLSAHMAGGADYEGRWSVNTTGRLEADFIGGLMEADASLSGDELTLALDDQALTLRRA